MEDRTAYFVKNRWKTPEGIEAKQRVIECIKTSTYPELILQDYVDARLTAKLLSGDSLDFSFFCVSDTADFRGIVFKNEDFSGSQTFETMDLSFSLFQSCTMIRSNFEKTILAETTFRGCDLREATFGGSSGQDTVFYNCKLQRTYWVYSFFQGIDFSSSNLRKATFVESSLRVIKLDVKTIFDPKMEAKFGKHSLSSYTKAKLYHELRMSYQAIHLQNKRDYYFRKENFWISINNVKELSLSESKNTHYYFKIVVKVIESLLGWIVGYGSKSSTIVLMAFIVIFGFAYIFYLYDCFVRISGVSFIDSVYFSLGTFTTLGAGDVVIDPTFKWIRALSALESLLGMGIIATYIAVLLNKYQR